MGEHGRILPRESTSIALAGGAVPQTDLKPQDLSPDLSKSTTVESLDAATGSIPVEYGVLPSLFNPSTTGPLVREA
jgi:hypothetical protein